MIVATIIGSASAKQSGICRRIRDLIGQRQKLQRESIARIRGDHLVPQELCRDVAFHAPEARLAITLVSPENENAVLFYRAAQRTTELVVRECRPGRQEGISGNQVFRLKVFKQAAVKLVAAGTRKNVDLAAEHAAILRRQYAFNGADL